ncbi:phage protease [Paractinoplanes maris]|uniref:phage protease n=1 Tax=Paractinoplanes maris TaxID=1734446 RepID=UPI0020212387|nr:phage protease [Actinoplanes maris]
MPDIELARREGVELVRTGSWSAASGSWQPTREDILSAVKATECPAVRRPRLKLGHFDPRFNDGAGDGEPALGWFENLRATDGGNTLVGDQVALPWLNQVQAAAYPDRSIEGTYKMRCGLGHQHPFVITAVALLGVTPPAVSALKSVQDLPEMLGVAAAEVDPNNGEHVEVTIHAAEDENQLKRYWLGEGLQRWANSAHPWRTLYRLILEKVKNPDKAKRIASDWYRDHFGHMPNQRVKASDGEEVVVVSHAQLIRDAWNASDPPLSQWVQEARPDGAVVVDDTDRTYRLFPVTWNGDEPVFGTPQAYDPELDRPLVFASRAESRPEPEPAPDEPSPAKPEALLETVPSDPTPELPAAEPEPVNTDPKEDLVSTDLSALRSRLGLDDTADVDAITAAVEALKTKAETPAAPTPEMVAASAAAVAERDELQTTVTKLSERLDAISTELAETKKRENDTVKASVLDAAAKEGKFKPAEREQWEADYDAAPTAITRVLASIAPGTAVPVMASGTVGSAEPTGGSDDEWDALTALLDGSNAKAV